MVHAGLSQLRRAFQHQRQPGFAQPQGRNLLLFYAVECGLKASWLTRNRLRDTSRIEQSLLREHGHDLLYWAKKLYLPAAVTTGRSSFRLRGSEGRLGVESAHQAWRYGVDLEPGDEAALENWLEQVWQWARGDLGL